jgi:hypothetical protein
MAVRSVTMRSLNRQRANLVFSHLVAYDKVLTPSQVSRLEFVFEKDGVLRWLGSDILGRASIGVGMKEVVLAGGKSRDDSGSIAAPDLYALSQLFRNEQYLLCSDGEAGSAVKIALKLGCSARSQLKAWLHALILAKAASELAKGGSAREKKGDDDGGSARAISSSLERTNALFDEIVLRLSSAGWSLDEAALETGCGPRIQQ